MLQTAHPLENENQLAFQEASHTYWLNGKKVPISVTSFLKPILSGEDEFDADAIIRKNLYSWRHNASSKYHVEIEGLTDDDAAARIKQLWDETRNRGTKLHALLEDVCNGKTVSTADRIDFASELDQYEHFRHDYDWMPFRTELCVAATSCEDANQPALAGSIDALYTSHGPNQKNVYIVDYKRTPKDLTPTGPSYGKRANHSNFSHRPLNEHLKYACQLATYRILLKKFYGLDTHGAYLLQLHKDLPHYNLIPVLDLRDEIHHILCESGIDVNP